MVGFNWFITQPAQKVSFQTELIFREFSSLDGLKQVDIPSITYKSVTDSTILTQYVTSHAKTFPTTGRSESRSREVAVKSP